MLILKNVTTIFIEGQTLRNIDDKVWDRLLQHDKVIIATESSTDKIRMTGRLRGVENPETTGEDKDNDHGMGNLGDTKVTPERRMIEVNE